MKVTVHQADLLPYSGFWYKMAKADLFDLKIYDQFQARGYQRRVMMREHWASLRVIGNPSRARICDVRILPSQSRNVLTQTIHGRYRDSRNWDTYGSLLIDMIEEINTVHLWQFNLSLMLGIRDLLGITTPIAVSPPPTEHGSAGLIQMLGHYDATSYLAGTGGRAYMGDCTEFKTAGIDVEWSAHQPVTGDSIVSVLMDYDDPMSVVLAEQSLQSGVAS